MPLRRHVPRAFLFLLILLAAGPLRGHRLEVELAQDRPGHVVIYYDLGEGAREAGTVGATHPGGDRYEILRFDLPDAPLYRIRLDPPAGPLHVRVRRARLLDDEGRTLVSVPPADFIPLHHAERVTLTADEATFRVTADQNDPYLNLRGSWLAATVERVPPAPGSPRQLFPVASWLLLVLVGAAAGAVVRWLAREPSPGLAGRPLLLASLGVGLLALGLRLWLYQDEISWAPLLDQFDGDLDHAIARYERGTLRWADLWSAHLEHRIVLTRVVSLFAFVLAGEWDNRVLAVFGLLLQAATAAVLAALAWRQLGWRRGLAVAAVVLLVTLGRHDWENVTSGFQIQFHGLLLASLVALCVLPVARPGSAASWAGLLALLVACGSMASGLITAAVCAGALLLAAARGPDGRVGRLLLAALAAALAALGLLSRVTVPGHAPLAAESLVEGLRSWLTYLAWPWPVAAGLLLWLPLLVLAGRIITRRPPPRMQASGWLPALVVWLLLQAAALAYGRATEGEVASRYTGLLACSVVVNTTAVAILGGASRRRTTALAGGWALLLAAGAMQVEPEAGRQLRQRRTETRHHEEQLRQFFRTGDRAPIEQARFPQIPHPDGLRLAQVLDDPSLARAWPAPLRREALQARDAAAAGVRASWLTAGARGLLSLGPGVILAGVLALGLAAGAVARRNRDAGA